MQCRKPASENILTLSDGRTVTLHEVLGAGRYGIVHRAFIEGGWGIRRPAAVKRMQLAPDFDPADAMRALGAIARRLVCIRHPSVIQLFELDRTDRLHADPHMPFMVTEIVEGESLQSLIASWQKSGVRAPVDFALVVVLRAAEALGAALFTEGPDGALTGLIHGDLSPRQVLVSSQGEVKVGDFGQFMLGEGQSHVRQRAALGYAAPEVVWGNTPDARSDVFSLGAILRELLVGPRFREGTSTRDAMRMIRDGQFHASLLEPNIPRAIRDILDQALDPNPAARYGHARAFAFDLRREMLKLNLTDAQVCIRHAIVGWCEAPEAPEDTSEPPKTERMPDLEPPPSRQHSDVVPRGTGLEDQEEDLPEFIFGSLP
ncbi:MAG: protein kinase [Labilithrix sp.]|nr:protein kinase [Labilithrix sp.]MCW5817852.1 protein kinase [Labilithrix sp.]